MKTALNIRHTATGNAIRLKAAALIIITLLTLFCKQNSTPASDAAKSTPLFNLALSR